MTMQLKILSKSCWVVLAIVISMLGVVVHDAYKESRSSRYKMDMTELIYNIDRGSNR